MLAYCGFAIVFRLHFYGYVNSNCLKHTHRHICMLVLCVHNMLIFVFHNTVLNVLGYNPNNVLQQLHQQRQQQQLETRIRKGMTEHLIRYFES